MYMRSLLAGRGEKSGHAHAVYFVCLCAHACTQWHAGPAWTEGLCWVLAAPSWEQVKLGQSSSQRSLQFAFHKPCIFHITRCASSRDRPMFPSKEKQHGRFLCHWPVSLCSYKSLSVSDSHAAFWSLVFFLSLSACTDSISLFPFNTAIGHSQLS